MKSKKKLIAALPLLPLLALSAAASAQVTIYGILDIGPTYVTNQGGKSNVRMDAGTLQQSRIGFRGTEDLGGGYSAFFSLENGFNLDDGSMATANNLFSRDSRVGLKGPFGSISAGRQSNATVDAIAPYAASMLAYGPSYLATHPGDHDRVLNIPTDNSLKYTTPNFAGFTGIVSYGFGEVAGDTKQNSSRNAGVSYINGPLSLGASYLWSSGNNVTSAALLSASSNPFGPTSAADVLRSLALGASYQFEQVFVHGNATQSKFGLSSQTARTYEIGSKINLSPTIVLGADYSYTDVKSRAKLNILSLSASYLLSKRTNLYVVAANESVSGTNANGTPLTAQLFTLPASSTSRQTALHMGIRHTF
ncbi:porin [Herbaspirillum autotrophicum]|uniref:porin n=1 Tax=Herbaspirillum autotrophicum TaxID=180195 RepID=UPI00067D222B|nr:porin [Herbaspirillum autotrophicum]